ncbi:MAG: nitrogen fixation protein NifQ [gamma proteobacterium symbiont of Bathyaustriella thionipta]|nr:nitrogen fixation protein NifQ [gamma proteobacterium symbiont of Bathyaustriella thionipta]MCU7950306.1 nitrogen fixation protein NifQ [gamma proteobacterium symbiont of Bathyaustriella thionipta]MCU7952310.1 nitrogen fixation protein NifQ [gamma proteobacterium symbiont of Bathyaustriella thionipta]MCU7956825.1 nitrogen fixation protein NifQ [gamma proteobacterium symbiont of Bathyaustriella thionipta]MCU7966608.1 nitrogen fixation protein NifQ [gamma proteobacterium symbiont of Bathyaustr
MRTRAMETPQEIYTRLMRARRGEPVEATLARILASWSLGMGEMPDYLGLSETNFYRMMAYSFPDYNVDDLNHRGDPIDVQRLDETEDLRKLLIKNRTNYSESELWMVDVVTAGCMGNDHLWQDLGLWQRSELSKLMMDNFHPLASRNVKDMKWKKFLYKQLCETEGIYTCRAPSCEVCADYAICFGPE